MLGLFLEASDDEGPEEMSFESAKNEALSRVKSALETAKREKEELKEKRRRRQELFQQQKKRRLLPSDVLDQMDSASPKAQEDVQDQDAEEPQHHKSVTSRSLKETYSVSTAQQQQQNSSFQLQAAQDFLQSRLYGPERQRTSNNELLSLQNKKGPHKQAAVHFVRKDWGSKQKSKAEKLKQRWIHKQKQQQAV